MHADQMPPRARVTIAHLADTLGLTKGTVSRALNGYPDIAESTRTRVARAAERMGYRPLSHAQAIRTGRTRSIGLVLQTDVPDAQRPFLSDFLAGVTSAASAEDWSLTVSTAGSDGEMADVLRRLIDERKADGFIVPRTLASDPRVALLRGQGVPFVMFGRHGDPAGCAWFDILGEDAMRDAVLRCAAHGHCRIAFVNGGAEYNFSALRAEGFRRGLADAGLAEDAGLTGLRAMTRTQGRRATEALLDLAAPPTAIIFAVDAAALGAYPAAAARGLGIGRDVSVIGYDGIPEGAYMDPALTTFNVDMRHAGSRLAELLIRQIRGADPETLRELCPAQLVPRGSDGPCRPATDQAL